LKSGGEHAGTGERNRFCHDEYCNETPMAFPSDPFAIFGAYREIGKPRSLGISFGIVPQLNLGDTQRTIFGTPIVESINRQPFGGCRDV